MKKFFTFLLLSVMAFTASADWYLVGDMQGSWDCSNPIPMTHEGDTWTYDLGVINGDLYFCFCTGSADNWDYFNQEYRYAISADNYTVDVRQEYQIQQLNGTIHFNGDGSSYRVTIFDGNKMKIDKIIEIPHMYVKSTWKGEVWEWKPMFSDGNGNFYYDFVWNQHSGFNVDESTSSSAAWYPVNDIQGYDPQTMVSGALVRINYINGTVSLELSPFKMPEFASWQSDCKMFCYFENALDWPTVCAYTYNAELDGAWPGSNDNLTKVGTNNGHDVYLWKYSGEGTCQNIIFNNSDYGTGNQTDDLVFANGAYYTFAGQFGQLVKVGETNWATFASPVDFVVGYDADVYYVSSVDFTKAMLTKLETGTKVMDGEGVLINTTEPKTVQFYPTSGANALDDNMLKGTLEDTPLVEGCGAYILSTNDEGKVCFRPTATGTIKANKAYLQTPLIEQAPQFIFINEGTVTGVDDLNIDTPKSGVRYNVMGQPVDENYRGIVIMDGKKFINK